MRRQDRLGGLGVELRHDSVGGLTLGPRPRFRKRRVRWQAGQRTGRHWRQDLQPKPTSAVELVRAAEDDRDNRQIGPQSKVGEPQAQRSCGSRRGRGTGLREQAQHRAGTQGGARGREVRVDGRPATTLPDRDHATHASEDEAPPARPKDRRPIVEEHEPRLDRQVVDDDERIDPCPMREAGRDPTPGRSTGGVARQSVGSDDLGPEAEEPTAEDPDAREQQAIEA